MSALLSVGPSHIHRPPRTSLQPEGKRLLSKKTAPLTMGPFEETRAHIRKNAEGEIIASLMHSAKRSQARYRRNKKRLCEVFENYAEELNARYPALAGFRQMLEVLGKIRDPLVQALLINGWVNTVISFDTAEARVSRRRSLVKALKDGKGVCVEIAELKLAALELAGFSGQDVRYVEEIIVKDGVNDSKHAVVEVRIGRNRWVLNNQQGLLSADTPIADPLVQAAVRIFNSGVKRDNTHLNLDADVITKTFYPYKSFNSDAAAIYERNAALWADYRAGAAFGNHDIVVDEPDDDHAVALKASETGTRHGFGIARDCMQSAIALRYGITPR